MPEPIFNTTQIQNSTRKTTASRKKTSDGHSKNDAAAASNVKSSHAGQASDEGQVSDEGQLSLDVFETPTELIIVAPVAGVKMSDINVSVTEDILTIKGQRRFETVVSEEDYLIQECFWGNFSRSIVLPSSVDSSKISASFKDGVLKIVIPRTEKNKMKLIKIKAE